LSPGVIALARQKSNTTMKDMFGNFLRVTPSFMGKWRLREIWQRTVADGDCRVARLPDGSILKVQLDVPYEQMVWLQDEEWDESTLYSYSNILFVWKHIEMYIVSN